MPRNLTKKYRYVAVLVLEGKKYSRSYNLTKKPLVWGAIKEVMIHTEASPIAQFLTIESANIYLENITGLASLRKPNKKRYPRELVYSSKTSGEYGGYNLQ